MVIISKVSKGTRMDQIYIPKNRAGLPIGTYVLIKPLATEPKEINLFYYNIKNLEPIKVQIIKEIFKTIEQQQVIITGSFLNQGFNFRDIDVLIITEQSINKQELENKLGIKLHLITINKKTLIKGLAIDPLYRGMISRCVSKSRLIFNIKPKINYKLLDLHLLKSKLLIENYNQLTGNEKYKLIRNLVSIHEFINKEKIKNIDNEIDNYFGKKTVEKLRQNILAREEIQKKYKTLYTQVQNKIFEGIRNEQK